MKEFEVSREDIERYVNIGFDLAVRTLLRDGTITEEQAEEYADYTCTSVTDKSVMSKLTSFFDKKPSNEAVAFKFVAVKLQHTNNEQR